MSLEIGQRVSSQRTIGSRERKYGNVCGKYKTRQSSTSNPITLYNVKWDYEDEISIGHMEQYLQKED